MAQSSMLSLWVVVLLQGLVLLMLAKKVAGSAAAKSGLTLGHPIPNLDIQRLDGGFDPLLPMLAPLTLVVLGRKGCPFCERLITELSRRSDEDPTLAVTVLAVGSLDEAKQLVAATNTKLPTYVISPGQFHTQLHLGAYPHAVLLQPDGTIVRSGPVNKQTTSSWLMNIPKRPPTGDHFVSA